MLRHTTLPLAALLLAAACAPKEDATVSTVAAVDTAAVKTGVEALRAQYIAKQTAGDATGLAGLFTDDGGIDLYGLPRLRGRTNIEAAFKTDMAARKYTLVEINPGALEARSNTDASELGTYHDMHDVNGKKDHEWGRYLVAFRKDADQWRLVYLIAFPDSTKADK